jgi:hypothetical protein
VASLATVFCAEIVYIGNLQFASRARRQSIPGRGILRRAFWYSITPFFRLPHTATRLKFLRSLFEFSVGAAKDPKRCSRKSARIFDGFIEVIRLTGSPLNVPCISFLSQLPQNSSRVRLFRILPPIADFAPDFLKDLNEQRGL